MTIIPKSYLLPPLLHNLSQNSHILLNLHSHRHNSSTHTLIYENANATSRLISIDPLLATINKFKLQSHGQLQSTALLKHIKSLCNSHSTNAEEQAWPAQERHHPSNQTATSRTFILPLNIQK